MVGARNCIYTQSRNPSVSHVFLHPLFACSVGKQNTSNEAQIVAFAKLCNLNHLWAGLSPTLLPCTPPLLSSDLLWMSHAGGELTTLKLWFSPPAKGPEGPLHCGELALTIQETWYSPHITLSSEFLCGPFHKDLRMLSINWGPMMKRTERFFLYSLAIAEIN